MYNEGFPPGHPYVPPTFLPQEIVVIDIVKGPLGFGFSLGKPTSPLDLSLSLSRALSLSVVKNSSLMYTYGYTRCEINQAKLMVRSEIRKIKDPRNTISAIRHTVYIVVISEPRLLHGTVTYMYRATASGLTNYNYVYCMPYSAYCISRVFNFGNFANLESFTKFIQLKFELLRCHIHGQHEFAKCFQQILSKRLFMKI